MAKIILGFVGPLASGKDVSRKYLEEKYQTGATRFSTMLRDILNRLHLEISRENMQNLSLDLRTRFGGDILARVIAADVKDDAHEIMVVDGIRREDDIVQLKDLPGFHLISIDADPKVRYERLKLRHENADDANKTWPAFLADCQKEAEREIPTVMALAKYQIDNNGDFPALYRQIDNIIETIRKNL